MHFELAFRHTFEMLLQMLGVYMVLAALQGSVCAFSGFGMRDLTHSTGVPQFPLRCSPHLGKSGATEE